MYVNGLFEELRKNRSGCWVGHTYLGILGYSDDNFLLAPSREALQVMLSICEKYAASHGLRFSTDPDPRKSKTKCLAFLQNEKVVKPVLLCGNELPWVSSCMHLGNTIVNTEKAEAGDIRSHDVKKKRACFIDKNNELIQEFYFAHPETINEVNKIQNSHFYGSVLWRLASLNVQKLEKSWNISVRRMFDLPMNTHCYLVEPISQTDHVQTLMARRFINFVNTIRKSKKVALKSLLKVVETDTRSVTGHNLRCLLLKSKAEHVQELNPKDESFKYREVPAGEEFRIDFIKEIIEVKNNKSEVPGFTMEELDEILQHLCGS